ncbi:MAG: hypothetical protein ABF242_03375 [Flavobacteriales bacterium]
MKTLLYILSFALVITSCKKEKPLENDSNSKTYTGLLVADCAMTPLPNETITVFIKEPQSFGSNTLIEQYRTDGTGNFNFTVDLGNGKYVNEIRLGGANITPDGPNSNTMGTIIAAPTADFVVKLKINNPYNVGDTLYIYDYAIADHIKIIAPFNDKFFSVMHNFSNINNRTLTDKNAIEVQLNHSVYQGTPGTASFNELSQSFESFMIEGCSGAIDTIVKVIN